MTVKRVLVVDDSALFRELLSEVIGSAPDLRVVGTARDAETALRLLESLAPDVLTLDIELPGMDGISLLRKLMKQRPTPVVMVSSHSERTTAVGLRALEAGAVEVVQKPTIDLRNGTLELADELVEKVREAARAGVTARPWSAPSRPPAAEISQRPRASLRTAPAPSLPAVRRSAAPAVQAPNGAGRPSLGVRRPGAAASPVVRKSDPGPARQRRRRGGIVAIGASTGGTDALLETLRTLPSDAPPIVIVQHMPPKFTAAFAARLNRLCQIKVKEAESMDPLLPGTALIAPGGRHIRLRRRGLEFVVQLSDETLPGPHKPSVDALFESCARQAGAFCTGILLTGMGADGAYGLGEMRKAGSITVAQDEASSVVFGMPKEAIRRGAAAQVLPLSRIPALIMEGLP